MGSISESQDVHSESEMVVADDHYQLMTDRNMGIINSVEQRKIASTVIAQAGVGGNADVVITLAQMGFQHFRIADPDVYETSNLNRQLGARVTTLSRNKAQVVAEDILEINPDADVKVYSDGITWDNVEEFVEGIDIVLDGLDVSVMHLRKRMFDLARERSIPVITCPVIGWGAGIAIFDPERSPSFGDFFGKIPDDPKSKDWQRFIENYAIHFLSSKPAGIDIALGKKRANEGKPPAIAASCRLNAALVSTAVFSCLFDKGNLPIVPTTLHVDLLGRRMTNTGPRKRWFVKRAIGIFSKDE
ncbi:MAG: ThiF family adenylyltransferase [Candidatus Thorarchaeota archaeon]